VTNSEEPNTSHLSTAPSAGALRVAAIGFIGAAVIAAAPLGCSHSVHARLETPCSAENDCGSLLALLRSEALECLERKERTGSGTNFDPECKHIKGKWSSALFKYSTETFRNRIETECYSIREPKGSAKYEQCYALYIDLGRFEEQNPTSLSGFRHDPSDGFNICNRACSYGDHAECCRIVNGRIAARMAARERWEAKALERDMTASCMNDCAKRRETCGDAIPCHREYNECLTMCQSLRSN
jgi:hypothetical protein